MELQKPTGWVGDFSVSAGDAVIQRLEGGSQLLNNISDVIVALMYGEDGAKQSSTGSTPAPWCNIKHQTLPGEHQDLTDLCLHPDGEGPAS